MSTPQENIDTAISNLCLVIATVSANPKPTYSVDGQTVSWESYFAMLNTQLKNLMEIRQNLNTPFQLITKTFNY